MELDECRACSDACEPLAPKQGDEIFDHLNAK